MPKKITTEDFILDAENIWNHRWDYSKTVYVAAKTKVTITCPEHGDFEQTPSSHRVRKVGCSECALKEAGDKARLPFTTFISQVTEVWGDRWIIDESSYTGASNPIKASCRNHGEFTQSGVDMLKGYVGCDKCKIRGRYKDTDYATKAEEVWGNRWDYSKTVWGRSQDKVTITCPIHGDFEQFTNNHIKGGVGCAPCRNEERRSNMVGDVQSRLFEVWGDRWDYSNTDFSVRVKEVVSIGCGKHGEFMQPLDKHLSGQVGCGPCVAEYKKRHIPDVSHKLEEVWGDRWDYSNTDLDSNFGRVVVITCKEHGDFRQKFSSHLNGMVGCKPCEASSLRLGEVEIMKRAVETWGDRWDYSKTDLFTGIRASNIFTCTIHGDFEQTLEAHLRGLNGCRRCVSTQTSGMEQDLLEFVRSYYPDAIHGSRKVIPPKELDIYIPEKNIGIEFNGLYWHSEERVGKNYHFNKFSLAQAKGIKLIQIWEDDWVLRNNIVKNHLRQVMNVADVPKVAARKTSVEVLNHNVASEFLEAHHIQGSTNATVWVGLTLQGSLTAVCGFLKRAEDYELVRYATNANVQGGHSKLVTFFERNYEYNKLITFADLTFGDGNLYRSTGWVNDGLLRPDYSYVVGGVRVHKFRYRKKKFETDPSLKFEPNLSERELAKLNNMNRVFDAGKIRFVKQHP